MAQFVWIAEDSEGGVCLVEADNLEHAQRKIIANRIAEGGKDEGPHDALRRFRNNDELYEITSDLGKDAPVYEGDLDLPDYADED